MGNGCEANIDSAKAWTEIDDDLGPYDADIAEEVRRSRIAFAVGDIRRASYWQIPEGVDVIEDIPYLDDGIRGHLLDVYLPHDAVVRDGHALPVIIDIHGGGFMYGYKDLNRNFCTHLAALGFAVFSVSYRLFPNADVLGQIQDVMASFAWIQSHLDEYPVNSKTVFVAGDSAGGALALFSMICNSDVDFAQQCGVERTGIALRGGILISSLTDLHARVETRRSTLGVQTGDKFSTGMFGRLMQACGEDALTVRSLASKECLPPLFLCTSSDDFIQEHTLRFAAELARAGAKFELHDWATYPGQTLGHVFPVNMSWLPESVTMLDCMRRFCYGQLN